MERYVVSIHASEKLLTALICSNQRSKPGGDGGSGNAILYKGI